MPNMAKLSVPHIQVNVRKGYSDVYFKVHPKDRPEGWKPSIKIGRTDQLSQAQIIAKAFEIYNEYCAFRERLAFGDIRSGTLPSLIKSYKKSGLWEDIRPITRRDYELYFPEIEKWSAKNGHPHISELKPSHAINWLKLFEETPLKQRRAKTVLSMLCKVAIEEGHIESNPIKQVHLRRRKTKKRNVVIWTETDVDDVVRECDARGMGSLGSIVLTGIETAQRQGDVIRMRNKIDYDKGKLIYVQSKTGKKVQFNATEKLRRRYETVGIGSFQMFIRESTGKLWTRSAVAHELREVCDFLGLNKHIFAHLRHSQIFYLNELKLSKAEIGAITGHSEDTVDAMLKNHYLEIRNEKLANEAVARIDEARSHRK